MIEHKIGVSRRSKAVLTMTRVTARPILRYFPMSGPATRLMPLIDLTAGLLPRHSGTVHKRVAGRHWHGEVVTPINGTTAPGAILYLHGGAFLLCGLGTHRRIVENLAHKTGMAVLNVSYRQLPDGLIEDSIADTLDAFAWLTRSGHAPQQIVLAGDSAGGYLAFAASIRLRETGIRPAGIVGLSPLLDFDDERKRSHPNAKRDAYIPAHRIGRLGELVCAGRPEAHHSPVNADLTNLPPALLIAGEDEILRLDAELMGTRLHAAGVPVRVQLWEGQVHAFPVLAGFTPEGQAAVDEIVAFTVARVAEGAQPNKVRAPRRTRASGAA